MPGRYHVNDKGEPGRCTAKVKCRLGGDLEKDHYDSPEAARSAYESRHDDDGFATFKKAVTDSSSTDELESTPKYAPKAKNTSGVKMTSKWEKGSLAAYAKETEYNNAKDRLGDTRIQDEERATSERIIAAEYLKKSAKDLDDAEIISQCREYPGDYEAMERMEDVKDRARARNKEHGRIIGRENDKIDALKRQERNDRNTIKEYEKEQEVKEQEQGKFSQSEDDEAEWLTRRAANREAKRQETHLDSQDKSRAKRVVTKQQEILDNRARYNLYEAEQAEWRAESYRRQARITDEIVKANAQQIKNEEAEIARVKLEKITARIKHRAEVDARRVARQARKAAEK